MTSPTIQNNADRLSYSTPTRNVGLPNNLNAVGASVQLLVGSAPNDVDGAAYSNKTITTDNVGDAIYTNYFVSQLQVSSKANTGDLNNFALQITYDEL